METDDTYCTTYCSCTSISQLPNCQLSKVVLLGNNHFNLTRFWLMWLKCTNRMHFNRFRLKELKTRPYSWGPSWAPHSNRVKQDDGFLFVDIMQQIRAHDCNSGQYIPIVFNHFNWVGPSGLKMLIN